MLVSRHPEQSYELYNLKEDPNELHNLITDPAYALVREELKKAAERLGYSNGRFYPLPKDSR